MVPSVSIGLPVYNGERFLGETLASIAAQSFEDFELIISDNASTDGTSEICRGYEAKDRRIQYHRNPSNIGAARNYNRVFERSRGRYFKWAAHDDLLGPEFLRRCVEVLQDGPGDVVIGYPQTILIDESGRVLEKYDGQLDLRGKRLDRRLSNLVSNLKKCNQLFGLIRSDVLRKTQLIGGYFASDVALLVELCLYGRFHYIDEELFYRRMHSGSSRRINRTYAEVAQWFDPGTKGKYIMPLCQLFYENLKSIRRSELEGFQKGVCYDIMIEDWLRRYWRQMGGEVKLVVREMIRRRIHSNGRCKDNSQKYITVTP